MAQVKKSPNGNVNVRKISKMIPPSGIFFNKTQFVFAIPGPFRQRQRRRRRHRLVVWSHFIAINIKKFRSLFNNASRATFTRWNVGLESSSEFTGHFIFTVALCDVIWFLEWEGKHSLLMRQSISSNANYRLPRTPKPTTRWQITCPKRNKTNEAKKETIWQIGPMFHRPHPTPPTHNVVQWHSNNSFQVAGLPVDFQCVALSACRPMGWNIIHNNSQRNTTQQIPRTVTQRTPSTKTRRNVKTEERRKKSPPH